MKWFYVMMIEIVEFRLLCIDEGIVKSSKEIASLQQNKSDTRVETQYRSDLNQKKRELQETLNQLRTKLSELQAGIPVRKTS